MTKIEVELSDATAKAAGDARIKLAEDALEQARAARKTAPDLKAGAEQEARIKAASHDRDKVAEDYSVLPPDFSLAGEVLACKD